MAEPAQKQNTVPPSDKRANRKRIVATPAANDPDFDHAAGSKPSARRGVQNVRRITRARPDHYTEKTISGQFEAHQSVPARTRKRTGKRDQLDQFTRTTRTERRDGLSATSSRSVRSMRQTYLPEQTVARGTRHFGFGAWTRVTIAGLVYMWQFLFSIFAMFGYTGEGLVRYFQEETTVGKALSWLVDLQAWFPGDVVGNLFTALNLIIVGGVFLIFICVYWLMKYRPFGSVGMFFFTSICIALSILPYINVLPYIVAWVIVMEVRGVYIRRRPKT